jgi:hypothetical protein
MTKHGLPMSWLKSHLHYDGDDCVVWPFTRTAQGYSRIWHNGQMRPAHRVMCEMLNGPPSGPLIDTAHSCGNGHLGCMNPKHLRWATKVENSRDRIAHGTHGRGEKHALAKLSHDDVLAIREMAPFAVAAWIAPYYGISTAQMSRIIRRQRWAA